MRPCREGGKGEKQNRERDERGRDLRLDSRWSAFLFWYEPPLKGSYIRPGWYHSEMVVGSRSPGNMETKGSRDLHSDFLFTNKL